MSDAIDFLDDPKLTAYALDELDAAERAEIDAVLAKDERARRAVEEIRRTASVVASGMTAAGGAGLTPAQRAAVAAEAARPAGVKTPWMPPVAMYASVAACVVVVGVVAYLAVSGTDSSKTETQKAEAPKSVSKDPASLDDFASMPFAEQHASMAARVAAAGADLAKLEQLHEWTNHPKVKASGEARAADARVVATALGIDKDCAWAREARGDHRLAEFLRALVAECGEAFERPDPEEKAVVERLASIQAAPWADAEEWAKFQAIGAKIRLRDDRMKKDPRYLAAEKKRGWVKENPLFKDVEVTWRFSDPYVVFQEVKRQDVRDTERIYDDKVGTFVERPKDGTVNPAKRDQNEVWARKSELFAKRDGVIFTELNRRFRELFAAEFQLPELKDQGRTLTALVMWNRASFDKLLKEAGQPVGDFVRAFYSPPQQKIFHYLGEESLQEQDELPCEGGYVQKFSDQVTAHEGTHQLLHEYAAIYRGTPLKDDDSKVDDRKALWFEEGMAEFMGACEVEEGRTEYLQDVHWKHNRILLERVQASRVARDAAVKWRIKDLLKPNNNLDLGTVGDKLRPGESSMPELFYARAWAFCHFLWHYDAGKYRPAFFAYLKDVMKGVQSSEKFATKIMKRPNVNDWGPVEMEYEWYWDQLLSRKIGRNKVTHQWERPSTEAPTGKVEDDPDWISVWQEDHQKDK